MRRINIKNSFQELRDSIRKPKSCPLFIEPNNNSYELRNYPTFKSEKEIKTMTKHCMLITDDGYAYMLQMNDYMATHDDLNGMQISVKGSVSSMLDADNSNNLSNILEWWAKNLHNSNKLSDVIKWWSRNLHHFAPEKVIFNNPATIVIWNDGTKTVVKCKKDDIFDPEKGLALCYMKKVINDDKIYHRILRGKY